MQRVRAPPGKAGRDVVLRQIKSHPSRGVLGVCGIIRDLDLGVPGVVQGFIARPWCRVESVEKRRIPTRPMTWASRCTRGGLERKSWGRAQP